MIWLRESVGGPRCEAAGVPAACLGPGGSGQPSWHVAKDLRISETCLLRWISIDHMGARRKESSTCSERKDLMELRRRSRVLEAKLEAP